MVSFWPNHFKNCRFTKEPNFVLEDKIFAQAGWKILARVGNSAEVQVYLGCEGMYTWGARGMLTMSPSTSGSHKKEFELKSSD